MTGSESDCAVIESDYPWCYEAVQDVSRTFALTVDLLEEPMSEQICVGYLLCRIADTIEDATHIPPADQTRLLRQYREALERDSETTVREFEESASKWLPPTDERTADWDVVARAPTVVATFSDLPAEARQAVRPPVLEMIDGMAMFVERYADRGGIRIQRRSELERYCYYVAGTVGNLVTNLLARDSVESERVQRMRATAESFGLLLQLVNVSKDVYQDYHEENNVYLPAEWLASENVDQDAVVEPENRDASARVVRRTVRFARTFLDEAQDYLQSMPIKNGNTLSAWLVPYLLAVGTLRELEDRPSDAVTDRGVKVTREEVFAVIEAARNSRPDAVRELRETVALGPYHRASEAY